MTNKEQKPSKPWYKKWWGIILTISFFPFVVPYLVWTKTTWNKWGKIAITAVCIIFLVSKANNSSQKKQEALNLVNQNKINQTETPSTLPAKTDQQILEENLASIVDSVGNDMSYRGLEVKKTDPDRPADAKLIIVSVNVESFYNKNSLLRDTGELSSSLFEAVYDVSSMKAYDIIVWYYGKTTDKYGNENNNVILTYMIDKVTYGKINWQNFDQSNLCDFLEQESKTSNKWDTACTTLVHIE